MRPLRAWAAAAGAKLLGACAGPPHLADEPLRTVAPLDLRCRSKGKDAEEEEEESTGSFTPTAKPRSNAKCPAKCDCDVSVCCHSSDLMLHLSALFRFIFLKTRRFDSPQSC